MTDDVQNIVSKLDQEAKTLPARKNRCIQHLTELGYISIGAVNAVTDSGVEKAKEEFLQDAAASGLYTALELRRAVFEDDAVTDLLARAVDIDEGFVFNELPAEGDCNLITRIIHYRLDIFGLWELPVNTGFSKAVSLSKIKTIAGHAKCSPLEAVNFMADVEKFTKRLLSVNDKEKFVIVSRPQKIPDRDFVRRLDRRHKFKRQLIEDFGTKTDFIRHLTNDILNNHPALSDHSFLFRMSQDDFSRFILRLIQVHQWQEGLYEGLLDSDIGEVTIKSIINAVDLYNITNRKNIQLHRVLTYVNNGYFLFNALFFLQEYMIEDDSLNEAKDAEEIILGNILESAARANDTQLTAFGLKVDMLKAEAVAAGIRHPQEKQGLLKRIYYGIRNLFKKVVKISKQIFRLVIELSDRFKGVLKKIFGHFFEQLSKGLKAFTDGIKYIMGRKSTTTHARDAMISSVIRIDGDSFSIVSGNAGPLIPLHTKKVEYHVASMTFSLSIVGGVMKLILSAINVISWPFIVFTIISIYKQISESFRKLESITT